MTTYKRGAPLKFRTADLCGAKTDRGHNMSTSSGLPFWPMAPRIEDVRVQDIAEHLARLCRFNGALRFDVEHYSVAQHCSLCSDNVPPEYALEALLHEAAEAYVGDRIKPLKQLMPDHERAERRIEELIRLKFGLPLKKSAAVKEADYRAVLTERRDVLHPDIAEFVDWGVARAEPWPEKIEAWGVFQSRSEWLRRFKELYRDD